METSKRSRTASKQFQAGPAPLASFEDLPSDELESPEDFDVFKEGVKACDIPAEDEIEFQRTSGTPDSVTISATSTPQVESDYDSQFTLTPGDSFKDQSSKLRTGSLSSLSKEKNLCVKQDKGSAVSLDVCGTFETQYEQRKSSWADIFHSHSSGKFESSQEQRDISVSLKPLSKKKSKSDQIKKDKSDLKPKEKGKFLSSLFKVGKKTSRNVQSPVSPVEFILPNTNQKSVPDNLKNFAASECDSENMFLDSPDIIQNSEGKENEEPKSGKITNEAKNDLSSEKLDNSGKISGNLTTFMLQVNNIKEDANIYDKQNGILFMQDYAESGESAAPILATNTHMSSVDDDHESSESELTFDTQQPSPDIKEDDFEAEKLLAQDSSEVEDYPVFEIQPLVVEATKHVVTKSKQQRLEVTTIPIERPRSTTPINIAPLEAFIQSVSPSADRKVEKLKLSLPGDQFINKLKSPRKGSTKSWTDFCESLHSPRFQKRIEIETSKVHSNSSNHIVKEFDKKSGWELHGSKTESPESHWATFDANFDRNLKSIDAMKGDVHLPNSKECSAVKGNTASQHFSNIYESHSEITKCVCECHIYGCEDCCFMAEIGSPDTCGMLSDKVSSTADHKVSVNPCICSCHRKQATLWNSSKIKDTSTDPFTGFDATQVGKTACSVEDKNF